MKSELKIAGSYGLLCQIKLFFPHLSSVIDAKRFKLMQKSRWILIYCLILHNVHTILARQWTFKCIVCFFLMWKKNSSPVGQLIFALFPNYNYKKLRKLQTWAQSLPHQMLQNHIVDKLSPLRYLKLILFASLLFSGLSVTCGFPQKQVQIRASRKLRCAMQREDCQNQRDFSHVVRVAGVIISLVFHRNASRQPRLTKQRNYSAAII